MALVKRRKKNDDGSIEYTVYKDGKLVAHVFKGWRRLGGEQWLAQMPYAQEFGEQTLKGLMKKIDALSSRGANWPTA